MQLERRLHRQDERWDKCCPPPPHLSHPDPGRSVPPRGDTLPPSGAAMETSGTLKPAEFGQLSDLRLKGQRCLLAF